MTTARIIAVAIGLVLVGAYLAARRTPDAPVRPEIEARARVSEPAAEVAARAGRWPVPGRPAPTAPPIEGLPVGSTLVSLANATTATSDPEAAPPLSALAPAGEQPAMSPERARFTAERDGYMAQTRARVEACWRALPGAGEIEFMYTLRAASLTGETEVTPSIETELGHDSPVNIVESSLTPEQNRAALDCMLDAVDGTSFRTVLPSPELGTLVVLHQRWRVGAVPARP